MAMHIPTSQIVDHFKSGSSFSIDGQIYKDLKVDDKNLTIGPVVFPLDYFDIGGISPSLFHFMDSDKKWHNVMVLGKDGMKVDHPAWNHEPYDQTKVRNKHLL